MDITEISVEFMVLLGINLAAGALGFVPSFLLTGININSFGITGGAAISLAGEIFGAVIGFYLYRYGFSKVQPAWKQSRFWAFMHKQPTGMVFLGILLFRLLPFVPSGLVTAGAALTKISGLLFFLSSSIGKIPAVIIEVAAVYGFTQLVPASYQYAAAAFAIAAISIVWLRKRKRSSISLRQ